jgi:phospholipid/cholesterol/gamma-HCH transport system substrate-binding protein
MNNTSRRAAIQVGITGVLALALLLFGVVWIKEYRLGQKKIDFTAHFEEVGNLSVGDPVSVRGVRKGAVTQVTLQDQGVRVDFTVDRDVILHPDASLRVANIGFMGEKFLALDPGSAAGRYDGKKPIPGRFQSGVPEVIAGAGDLLTEATELSSRLNLMLDSLDPATIERAAKNMAQASESLNHTLSRNQDDLRQAVTDFRAAAHDLKAIAAANKGQVSTSVQDFGEASRKLSNLADQLSATATSLDRVVDRIDSQQGTLGKAIADSTLYQEMRETLRNTNDLVKDIKKNPKRYLKIGLF